MKNEYVGILYHEIPDLIMLTYPRSGRHWLYWNVLINTDLKINFFHGMEQGIDMKYYKDNILVPIITVVRSPEECLASINTMEHNSQFDDRINEYIDHYEFVLKHADMFFLYEDLKEKTPKILEAICDKYGGKNLGSSGSFDDYKAWYKETQNPEKLITSKDSSRYNDALECTKAINLDRHKELYLAAKDRCIIF
jgi:hypothetical protein